MPTYRFDEVAVRVTRTYRDANGKRRQETRKFYQTLNPFNRNAAGIPKTRDEIMAEILAERAAWLATPTPPAAPGEE